MQLQFGGPVGAVGGMSVEVGQSAVAPPLGMMSGGGAPLESHPALMALSQEVRVESRGERMQMRKGEGEGIGEWDQGSEWEEEMEERCRE